MRKRFVAARAEGDSCEPLRRSLLIPPAVRFRRIIIIPGAAVGYCRAADQSHEPVAWFPPEKIINLI